MKQKKSAKPSAVPQRTGPGSKSPAPKSVMPKGGKRVGPPNPKEY